MQIKSGFKSSELYVTLAMGVLIALLDRVGIKEVMTTEEMRLFMIIAPLGLAWLGTQYTKGRVSLKLEQTKHD